MGPRRRLVWVLGSLILAAAAVAGREPARGAEIGRWGTGQFADRHPTWWWNEGKCDSTATQDAAGRKPGAKCLQVVNKTPRGPNRFGTTQQAVALVPGQTYQITLWARAKGLASDGGVNVAVDEAWKVRPISLPKGTYDWTRFTGTFSLATPAAQLRVLSEDVGEAWIDEIRIEPVPPPAKPGPGGVAAGPLPNPRAEPEDAVWITPAGGFARTKDAAVAIPAGAAAKPFRLRLYHRPGEETNFDPNLKVGRAKIAIEAPDAPPLAKPARVTLSFEGQVPVETDPKRIVPVVHNGRFWEKVYGATIDTAAKRATFDVRWFGATAVAIDQEEVEFLYLYGLGGPYFRDVLLHLDKTPPFVVEYVPGAPNPPDIDYLKAILDALLRSHEVLVSQMQYDPPAIRPIVVRVRDMKVEEVKQKLGLTSNASGVASLAGLDPQVVGGIGQILIDSKITDGNHLRSASAHEFFHLLQGAALCRNGVSLDRVSPLLTGDLQWLAEASAEWAADAVFDDLNGYFGYLPSERDYTFKGAIQSSRDGAPQLHPYAGAAFLKFLAWRYGKDFVRQAWGLARTDVKRDGHTTTLDTSFDVLSAACGRLQTADHRNVDLATNVATFALYFNFLRNLGESSQWFPDKRPNQWLFDSGPHWNRVSLKTHRKGSVPLGAVKPLGTGPLLRLDHEKDKPLDLVVRLKPEAIYSARQDTGMVLVVFGDEQRILQVRPFNGAGGSVKAAAKTASHVVVIPLNTHSFREFAMTLEWQTRRNPEEEVYVRGPMQVLQYKLSPDTPWSIATTQTSATMTYSNPKTGRKDVVKFTWTLPPEKMGRFGAVPIQFTGSFQPPAKPKPPTPAPAKPAPAKPSPIEMSRTYVPGKPERSIRLTERDEGTGWVDPDRWTARGMLFAGSRPGDPAVRPAEVRAYLADRSNFIPQMVNKSDFRGPDGSNRLALFELGITFWDNRPGVDRKQQSLRLSVEKDRPVARVGFYFTGEQGLMGAKGRFAAAVFWDYTLDEQSP